MNRILVPTDFSKYAEYAFEAACQIALRMDGHLHLYHCADIPDHWEDLSIEDKLEDFHNKNEALATRQKLIELHDEAIRQNIQSSIHYTGGQFLNRVSDIVEEHDIDLIVMGSHGASGKEEWFIGSNSQKVIRKIKVNTLIVKNPLEHFSTEKAVFVSDLNENDQESFRSFLNFIQLFDTKEVHVLSIDTSAWFTQPALIVMDALEDFKKVASGYNCNVHFYKDYSVQSGIRHFIEDHKIDIVGISYRSRNPVKRIFMGSNVEMLVNHSDIPVLCIND